jgi:hypothetical protein
MKSLGERKKERSRVFSEDESNRYKQKQEQRITRRRCGKEEITEEERGEKWGHTPPGANYERDCTL